SVARMLSDGGYIWSEWPDDDGSSFAMSHTSIVLTRGCVVSGAASEASLVFRDTDGNVEEVVPIDDAVELHGLTLDSELLWVADPGFKVYGGKTEIELREGSRGGQVFQVDLEGRRRRTLEPREGWQPTGVAVGANGDVWVADGYGESLVH